MTTTAQPLRRPRRDAARYVPLVRRVAATNAVLLALSCLFTIAILSPHKIGSFAVDEAVLLAVAIAAVIIVNRLLLGRAFAPLQALTAFVADYDPATPGRRAPVQERDSEARELGLRFNEMLDRLQAERRESTRRAVAAQEAERLRVAQELHDEVGQKLTAVLLQLGRVSRNASDPLAGELAETQELVRSCLEDARRIAVELRPEALDDFGLIRALSVLADRLTEHTGLEIERSLDQSIPPLQPEVELVIYRIAQEALTNVVRHAETDLAHMRVAREEGLLVLTVTDRGRGGGTFEEGTGVRGMRERAALIDAELTVGAGAGSGTEVRLALSAPPERP